MTDNLIDLIDILRREMPEASPEFWDKVLTIASRHFGLTRLYVPARPKRAKLEALAAAQADADTATLADMIGATPRRVLQLQKLRRG